MRRVSLPASAHEKLLIATSIAQRGHSLAQAIVINCREQFAALSGICVSPRRSLSVHILAGAYILVSEQYGQYKCQQSARGKAGKKGSKK